MFWRPKRLVVVSDRDTGRTWVLAQEFTEDNGNLVPEGWVWVE